MLPSRLVLELTRRVLIQVPRYTGKGTVNSTGAHTGNYAGNGVVVCLLPGGLLHTKGWYWYFQYVSDFWGLSLAMRCYLPDRGISQRVD